MSLNLFGSSLLAILFEWWTVCGCRQMCLQGSIRGPVMSAQQAWYDSIPFNRIRLQWMNNPFSLLGRNPRQKNYFVQSLNWGLWWDKVRHLSCRKFYAMNQHTNLVNLPNPEQVLVYLVCMCTSRNGGMLLWLLNNSRGVYLVWA